jgi:hypothetical protein
MLAIFIEKLTQICSPYEQSLFITTYIAYIAPYSAMSDIVALIASNIPLILYGLPPLTLS